MIEQQRLREQSVSMIFNILAGIVYTAVCTRSGLGRTSRASQSQIQRSMENINHTTAQSIGSMRET